MTDIQAAPQQPMGVRSPEGPERAERVAGGPATAPRWWIWLAAWPVTAVFVLSNAATPLYVLWQRDIGFSKGMLTVIFAWYIVGLIASLLVSGVVSDRVGRKPVLLPALVLAAVACLIFATASSVAALIIARLLTGIAVGAVVSAGMAAVSDVAGPARKRLGALLASCAMVLGAGLGPLLAGVLSETAPAPTVSVFVVEIALLAAAFLAVLRMPLPTKPRATRDATRDASKDTSKDVAEEAPKNTTKNTPKPDAPTRQASWIRVPGVPRGSRPQLLLGIAVFAPGITATSFVLSLGPSLLSGLLGTTSRIVAGAMAFVMFLAATAVQFAVRKRRVRTILLSGAMSTTVSMAALMAAVHTSSVVLLIAAAVLAGAGQGMGQLGGLSLLNAAVPSQRLAEANAALNVGGYVPAGVLPVVAGFLSDAVGLTTGSTIFGVVLVTMAVCGGLVALAHRHATEPA